MDAALTAFNWMQDHLAENGQTRAQARPTCPAGHAHPAICQNRRGFLYLVCPAISKRFEESFSPRGARSADCGPSGLAAQGPSDGRHYAVPIAAIWLLYRAAMACGWLALYCAAS